MIKEFLFTDRGVLFATLASNCQQHLQKALNKSGKTSLMVSGGSTPAPLYKALAQSNLDWRNISVALVDERWVDENHEASNEALIKRTLLTDKARLAPFTGMKNNSKSALKGSREAERYYQFLPRPFAVTIVGMGSDGHTASLFPHALGLNEALSKNNDQLTTAILATQSEVTGSNIERLSLSLNGLLQSERIIILLTGDEKLEVFRQAQQEGAIEDMPIRALLHQNKTPVELYWAP